MKPNTLSRHQNIPNPASYRAFTLVELVVVVTILALVAAMSLPALCKTNIKSHGLQCMSNMKTLNAAWTTWSLDNGEKLMGSRDWVVLSDMSDPASVEFIDLNRRLTTSPFIVYLGENVKVYKCPADPRVSTHSLYKGTPIARSYSVNIWMGTDGGPGYTVFKKMSDMNRPGPANTFVFADEGKSINDPVMFVPMDTYDPINLPGKAWIDVPASFHSNAGNLSFVDGHVETHKWTDARTLTATIATASPNNLDIDWLQSKSSAKITNPTR